jgi:hypothetical protein
MCTRANRTRVALRENRRLARATWLGSQRARLASRLSREFWSRPRRMVRAVAAPRALGLWLRAAEGLMYDSAQSGGIG